jgi:hypothetical protein
LDQVDEWGGYQFDCAVLTFGRTVEKALHDNAGKKKRERKPEAEILAKFFGRPGGAAKFGTLSGPFKTVKPGDPEFELLAGRVK